MLRTMTLPHATAERLAQGQQRRKVMRRAEHEQWKPLHAKRDLLAILRASEHGRIPSLVKLKHERMAASPFGFFRGAVPLMAHDLSQMSNTGIYTQLCGDAHVRNLGAYAGPDGRLVFDINDFDETICGPFEWDVKRLATSILLAGREAGTRDSTSRRAVTLCLEQYRQLMLAFSRMPVLEVARYQVHRLHRFASLSRVLQKAERAIPLLTLQKLTTPDGKGQRVFKSNPPVLKRVIGKTAASVLDSLGTYAESLLPERRHFLAQYRPVDVAFKVVGTGSVGLRDYCVYMEGNGPSDPLFLQIKEETASAYNPYLRHPPAKSHQGRRVADGQRAMQLQSDPFLGWTRIADRDYLVRQLNDHKAAIEVSDLSGVGLAEYAMVCGEMLARGHARAGDACVIAGYIGRSSRFDNAVLRFATEYANQTEADSRAFVKWLKQKSK
jgi:uncharacterized protein (DUF2252 family)